MCELNHCDLVMDATLEKKTCCNDPDIFCHVCGIVTPQAQRRKINNFVKKVCRAYFKVTLRDQDKTWAPHKVCKTSVETWYNETIHQNS
uniref:Uncharacterized protein n=1 Tax=Octopus bimaculoides TaxID=37653 RepID=A0A0L8I9R4_OCTBM